MLLLFLVRGLIDFSFLLPLRNWIRIVLTGRLLLAPHIFLFLFLIVTLPFTRNLLQGVMAICMFITGLLLHSLLIAW